MNRSDVQYNIDEHLSFIKGVGGATAVLAILAGICYGISVSSGVDIPSTAEIESSATSIVGSLSQVAAIAFGILAAACAGMTLLAIASLAICSAAFPLAKRDAWYETSKRLERQRAEEQRALMEKLDPHGKWW